MPARDPLAVFLLVAGAAAECTDGFHEFLDTLYGHTRLKRKDMGRSRCGSFGGKIYADQPINNEVSGGEWADVLGL